jgi:hypothetical protein
MQLAWSKIRGVKMPLVKVQSLLPSMFALDLNETGREVFVAYSLAVDI